jgi:histidine transport system substrate-binding protein
MKLLCNLSFLTVLPLLAGVATAAEYDDIRFGVDANYAPFESKAPDGSLVGFDIELGNAICAAAKAKCKWVESDFDGLIPGLKANKFDGILSSMTVTPSREKAVDFTDELFSGTTSYVFKKGSGLSVDVNSMKGKSVGFFQGSIQENYAKTVLKKAGAQVRSYQTQNQVYYDLVSGRLDASLQDFLQAKEGFLNQTQGAEYEASEPVVSELLPSKTAIAVTKGNEKLKNQLNAAIKAIHDDGTYSRLQTKYFGDVNLYRGE